MSYTQGPWSVEDNIAGYVDREFCQKTIYGDGYVIAAIIDDVDDIDGEANAYLIAAALDSHESNQWLLDAIVKLQSGEPVRDLDERILFAECVIAKAEGEQK